MTIRSAAPADAPALLAIYAPYVAETAVSFEYDVPTEAEFARRMEGILARYPYLVLSEGDEMLGYAYAGPFKGRASSRAWYSSRPWRTRCGKGTS